MGYINIPVQTSGQLGSVTNDSAAAGYVGEATSGSVLRSAANGLATTTVENIGANTNLVLSAGDWLVSAMVGYTTGASTITQLDCAVVTTSATMPGADVIAVPTSSEVRITDVISVTLASVEKVYSFPEYRVSIATSTTLYLVASATFSAGTVSVYGSINARRVR